MYCNSIIPISIARFSVKHIHSYTHVHYTNFRIRMLILSGKLSTNLLGMALSTAGVEMVEILDWEGE